MYLYQNKEVVKKLYQELEEWLGTPFRHKCCVKGKGVDCIHLASGVFTNIGLIDKIKGMPDYSPDWHVHNTRQLLLEGIQNNTKTDIFFDKEKHYSIHEFDLENGDLLIYQFGKAGAHIAVYCYGHIYHSLLNTRVIKTQFMDLLWYPKLIYGVRVIL